MSFRLKVDMDRCKGHGICAVLAARSIDLDQWGFPVIQIEPLSDGRQTRQARHAVAACPARALQLELVPDARAGQER
ncbi:MAG: ferredoxin [Candidatus Dormibacteria bacterium]